MPRLALLLLVVLLAEQATLPSQAPAVGQVSTDDAQATLDKLIRDMEATQSRATQLRSQLKAADTPEAAQELFTELQALSDRLQSLSKEFQAAVGTYKLATNPLRAEVRAALADPDLNKSLQRLLNIHRREQSKTPPDPLLATIRYCVAETYRLKGQSLRASSRTTSQAITAYKNSIKYFDRALKAPDLEDSQIGTSVHAACNHGLIRMHAALFDYYDQSFRKKNRSSKGPRDKHHTKGREAVSRLQRLHADDYSLNPKPSMNRRRFLDLAADDIRRLTR